MTKPYTPESFAAILSEDDDDDLIFHKGDTVLFAVNLVENIRFSDDDPYETIMVSFAEKNFWEENEAIHDDHLYETFEALGYVLPDYLSEDAENIFVVVDDTITMDQVRSDLEAIGLHFSQELTDYLESNG